MCATGSEAFRNACYAVASGAYDMAMAIGVEKLKDSGFSGLAGTRAAERRHGAPRSPRRRCSRCSRPAYAKKYGVDEDEMKDVLTRIAWKNHHNGARNPRAQFRKEVSKETICALAARRRPARHLRLLRRVSDGSAAAIIVRAEDAHRYTDKPLYVKALSFVAGPAAGPDRPRLRLHDLPRGGARPPRTPTAGRHHRPPRRAGDGRGARLLHADRARADGGPRASPSGARRGRKCSPARSTSTASCR